MFYRVWCKIKIIDFDFVWFVSCAYQLLGGLVRAVLQRLIDVSSFVYVYYE